MLFGHQNDVSQQQPDDAGQSTQNFVGPQDASTQDSAAQQQGADSGVNPLAVDPATGASLPAVTNDYAAPTDNSASTANEPASVLDQPSAPGTNNMPATAPAAANPDEDPAPMEDASSLPDPGTPFSTSSTPVLDSAQEAQEAAAIASELDTPADDQSPAAPEDSTTAKAFNASADTSSTSASATDTGTNGTLADSSTPDDSPLLALKQQAINQLSPLVNHLDQVPEEKFRTTMMLLQSTDNPALLHDAYTAAQSITDDGARAQALLDVVNEINYFTQQQGG